MASLPSSSCEIWGGAGRCGEMWGDYMASLPSSSCEIWGGAGRCGEIELEHRLQLRPADVLAVEVHQPHHRLDGHLVRGERGVDVAQKVARRVEELVREDGIALVCVEHQVVRPDAALAIRVDELASKVHRREPVRKNGLRARRELCLERRGRHHKREHRRRRHHPRPVAHRPPPKGTPANVERLGGRRGGVGAGQGPRGGVGGGGDAVGQGRQFGAAVCAKLGAAVRRAAARAVERHDGAGSL
mmetsp:Transcript_25731/g.76690  ORF Transcript_25731/g.76690 Transcript_25731/m.76690 type:complete len:244 (-) Transcript_25731:1295-2026(-)